MSTPPDQLDAITVIGHKPLNTFLVKQLRFTFTLSNNSSFAGTNSNVLTVTGLRATVTVKGSGLPAFPEAEIAVFGMLQQDMIALTAIAFQPDLMQRATVVVEANSGGGWSTAFAGQIISGGPDYEGIPHVPYRAQCRVLGFESLNPATATSYTGPTSVSTVVSAIAAKMGYAFVNNGVEGQLDSPYFDNTLAEQLRTVKRDAGIEVYIENNTITIAPAGQPLDVPSFRLTPSSGLRGYPRLDYQRGYVNVSAIYNQAFRFGGPVTVDESQVPTANGDWVIGTLTHRLESVTPNGAWFSELQLYPAGNIPPES